MTKAQTIKTPVQVRRIVKAAQEHIKGRPEARAQALMNPIAMLAEAPYNLTFEEIKQAYNDPALNIAHPDHPSFAEWESGVGCILC